ncbi:phosphoglucosamine mutase [Tenuibacillus multivorans]|uniref:Phosphoglucosamine mutase n=1 Tax=Tenuibacillus multivorans TaxID=237069 RepID=A0A1H0FEW6_9BACI|nr:phosphoglucosamine mutase [Tenuibacillus multivorans]GEL77636.1 phosphoglucosamine mutase [Tenuibacillus multivorans]SDN93247.1 phosphoglucosamine mutase [Tenuibacillus multivorans]
MGKYFGTDGVRGIANTELTPELAYKLGRFGGYVLTKDATEKPKILVGRDTRISGEMLEGALVAGILSVGVEVMRLGVISTPGVAFLTKASGAQAGVMISASHNPVEDNGIKFFGSDGFKLLDAQEEEIETLLDAEQDDLPRPTGGEIGQVMDYYEGGQKYLQHLKQTVDQDFEDVKIVLDCAHGATSPLASHLFADLEADILAIGSSPDGLNINDGYGSTNPEKLRETVVEQGADIGLAFDGDGDRLIAVDEKGNIVDGDKIMYICGRFFKKQGRLKQDTVVTTVMSNIGLYRAFDELDISTVKTKVGDRYVMEEMRKNDYNLGGEQSGHIIFLDHNTTGDGMLSALQLVNVMQETGQSLSELAEAITKFPQVLKNVRVTDKHAVTENDTIKQEIDRVEQELGNQGRVLVRPSGTEPVVRVMVEAPTKDECEKYVNQVVETIEATLGM